jgi:hypothetical protein
MKYLLVEHGNGNHGHRLKDLFGGITAAKMFGFIQIFMPYPYLDFFGLHYGERRSLPSNDLPQQLVQRESWMGMTWDMAHERLGSIADGYLVRMQKGARIHPFQVAQWFQEGKLDRDIFSEIVEEASSKFLTLHGNSPLRWEQKKTNIAIHACFRTVGNGNRHDKARYVFPMTYYLTIMEQLRQQLQNPIFHIFCEADDAERVNTQFCSSKDVCVHIGSNRGKKKNYADIHQIFLHFVRSDILVTCNSGFGVMATYFRHNKPTIYHPHNHLEGLPLNGFYIPTKEDGQFDSTAFNLNQR